MVFRALVVASLVITATAHAQAPGDTDGSLQPPGMMAPTPVLVGNPCACGGGYQSVMANRWAVGLSFGSLGIAPRESQDNPSKFGLAEISLRFRATLHLELELAFGGGRERLPDGSQGDREVSVGALDLRYRFAPEHKWNWWLMGGLGSLSITQQGATDQQRQDARVPMSQLGIGIERRFRHFAIDAELRAISAAPDQSQQSSPPPSVMGTATPMTTTTQPPPPAKTPPSSMGEAGGVLTIGASFYF